MQIMARGPYSFWQAADGSKALFERLEPNFFEPHPLFRDLEDSDGGILILADNDTVRVECVENLMAEIEHLCSDFAAAPEVYWLNVDHVEKRALLFDKYASAIPLRQN